MKISCFKKLSERFAIDRKTDSIDRKLHSIDPASIKHQSSQADSNQNFNCNFNQSSNKFDWSKIWKNQIFEKQSKFMQKLLKAWYFMNEMHEYEIKSFSKTLELNPNLMFSKLLVPRILMPRVRSSCMFLGAICFSSLMLIRQEVFMECYTSKCASKQVFGIVAI